METGAIPKHGKTEGEGGLEAVRRLYARAGDALAAERQRWPLWLPVCFGLGIAGYFSAATEPPLWAGPLGALVCLLVLAAFRRFPHRRFAIAAVLVTALGFAAAQARSALVEAPRLTGNWGPAALSGQILSVEQRARGWRFLLRPEAMAGLSARDLPAVVRVTAHRVEGDLRPGSWVALRARLRAPSAPTMPGAFDFARKAYFERIGGIGFALGPVSLRPVPQDPGAEESRGLADHWSLFWAGARQGIAERVSALLPGQSGAVAVALITGQRGAITEETREAMRAAGLAHLLAISGLHMGLVSGILFYVLRAALALSPGLALFHPIKKWAAVAAGLGAFVYLCLVGATIPAQRAFIMVGIVLLAVLLDRRAISLRLVAWAALLVLLFSPESLVSASFQLSFAAVVALVAAYEAWDRRGRAAAGERGWTHRLAVYVFGIALTSLIAILATSAFAAFHFQRLAVFGLLANLIAVPLTAFVIMPAAVLGLALMPFGLEVLGFLPMGWGIEVLLAVATAVAGLPAALVQVPPMPLWGLSLVVFGGLWLCLWQGRWRFWGMLPILLGACSPAAFEPPDLLVSGDGRLVALRDAERRLWLADLRASRFVIDSWRRGSFAAEVQRWTSGPAPPDGALTCDPLGCLYRRAGAVAAVSLDPRGIGDDCARADVLVSLEPLRRQPCRGPTLVIDRFDLWRRGGHAVWLGPEGPRAVSVREVQGLRPWSSFPDERR